MTHHSEKISAEDLDAWERFASGQGPVFRITQTEFAQFIAAARLGVWMRQGGTLPDAPNVASEGECKCIGLPTEWVLGPAQLSYSANPIRSDNSNAIGYIATQQGRDGLVARIAEAIDELRAWAQLCYHEPETGTWQYEGLTLRTAADLLQEARARIEQLEAEATGHHYEIATLLGEKASLQQEVERLKYQISVRP